MPDVDVRRITAGAVRAMCDLDATVADAAHAGRRALSSLPGFRSGDALAAARLLAAAPERMAAYDRRAHTALRRLGIDLDASETSTSRCSPAASSRSGADSFGEAGFDIGALSVRASV